MKHLVSASRMTVAALFFSAGAFALSACAADGDTGDRASGAWLQDQPSGEYDPVEDGDWEGEPEDFPDDPSADWSLWVDLGGTMKSEASCLAFGAQERLCFVRGPGGGLQMIRWTPEDGWEPWRDLGGRPASRTLCIATGIERDVLCAAAGKDGDLIVLARTNEGWDDWQSLGGNILYHPRCAAWTDRGGAQGLSCFAHSGEGKMVARHWRSDDGWTGWQGYAGDVNQAPFCMTGGEGRLDCFARTEKDSLQHLVLSIPAGGVPERLQGGWTDLGGRFDTTPNCTRFEDGSMDCFMRGNKASLRWISYRDGAWSNFVKLGGRLSGRPECLVRDADHLACYYRDKKSKHLFRLTYDRPTDQWSDVSSLGGFLRARPECTLGGPAIDPDAADFAGEDIASSNVIHCFVRGRGNALWWLADDGIEAAPVFFDPEDLDGPEDDFQDAPL